MIVRVGDASFMLELNGVTAVIEPQSGRSEARVLVTAPLRFTAEYPLSRLRFALADAVDLYHGRVRLGKGALPLWLGRWGPAMRASAFAILGFEVSEPLDVPCGQLELREETSDWSVGSLPGAGSPTIGTGTGSFPLYVKPEEKDPVNIRYTGPFRILERQPGWVLIEAAWSDGSRLHGWTPEANTTPSIFEPEILIGGVVGRLPCMTAHRPWFGRLRLRRGAQIAASPGGPVWASAPDELTVNAYPKERSDGWLRIGSVSTTIRHPNHCGVIENMWVNERDALGDVGALEPFNDP